jgi:hypothetical protein
MQACVSGSNGVSGGERGAMLHADGGDAVPCFTPAIKSGESAAHAKAQQGGRWSETRRRLPRIDDMRRGGGGG